MNLITLSNGRNSIMVRNFPQAVNPGQIALVLQKLLDDAEQDAISQVVLLSAGDKFTIRANIYNTQDRLRPLLHTWELEEFNQPQTPLNLLNVHEQQNVLCDPRAISCLIDHYDAEDAGDSEGSSPDRTRRISQLLKRGRALIAKEPDIWDAAVHDSFKLRHSEKQA